MADDEELDDGMAGGLSTPKKVLAGAALGVAVPAAVGVARKVLGGGSDDGEPEGQDDDASSEPTSREVRTAQRSSSRQTRATKSSAKRATKTKAKKASTRPNRTREQLYRQATRLKIDGRSSMNKAQLERAIERAKAK
jgi:hypothetical protein